MWIPPAKTIQFPYENTISELERYSRERFSELNYKFIKSPNNNFFAVFAKKDSYKVWIYKLNSDGSYEQKGHIEELPLSSSLDFIALALDNKGQYIYISDYGDDRRRIRCFETDPYLSIENRLKWTVEIGSTCKKNYSSPFVTVDNRNHIYATDFKGDLIILNRWSLEIYGEILLSSYIDGVEDMKLTGNGRNLIILGYEGEYGYHTGKLLSINLKDFKISYIVKTEELPVKNIFCSSTNIFYLDQGGVVHLHNLKSGREVFKSENLSDYFDVVSDTYEIYYKNKHLFISDTYDIHIFTLKGRCIGRAKLSKVTFVSTLDFINNNLIAIDKEGVKVFALDESIKIKSELESEFTSEDLDCKTHGFHDVSYYPDSEHLHLTSEGNEYIIDILSKQLRKVEESNQSHIRKYLHNQLSSNNYLMAEYDGEQVFLQNLIRGSKFEVEFNILEEDDTEDESLLARPYFSENNRFFGLFRVDHIKIFDLYKKEQLVDVTIPIKNRYGTVMSFSPCSPIVIFSNDDDEERKSILTVWNLSNRKVLFSKQYSHKLQSTCRHTFSPCGKYILVYTSKYIYQYDLEGNLVMERESFDKYEDSLGSIYFISNEGYFVTASDESKIWHIDKKEPIHNTRIKLSYRKIIPLNNNRFAAIGRRAISIIKTTIKTSPISIGKNTNPKWENLHGIKKANELEVYFYNNGKLENQNEHESEQRRLENERQNYRREEQEREKAAYRREEQEKEEEQKRRREREEAESRRREQEEESARLRKESEEQERTYTLEEIWDQSSGYVKMNALSACYYHQADGRCSYRDREDWCDARDGRYNSCWDTDSLDHCIKSEIGKQPKN
ncbi:NHL repeat-containing protein [Marinifilum flexuosum]|uniref:WD40 repeat protein n=1 Tax=Marinifilum flexuosum TaxID=1117708 RepID=A0A419X8V4_9BACT|nr:hypothetical protein [Marinifilum flexuosum]RKE04178.1 hypothetical protein BXY64_1194 [Marinifilum flexuosum]